MLKIRLDRQYVLPVFISIPDIIHQISDNEYAMPAVCPLSKRAGHVRGLHLKRIKRRPIVFKHDRHPAVTALGQDLDFPAVIIGIGVDVGEDLRGRDGDMADRILVAARHSAFRDNVIQNIVEAAFVKKEGLDVDSCSPPYQ